MHQIPPPKPSEQYQETKKGISCEDALVYVLVVKLDLLVGTFAKCNIELSLYFLVHPRDFAPNKLSVQHLYVQKTADNTSKDVACLSKPLSQYEKQSFDFRINELYQMIVRVLKVSLEQEYQTFGLLQLDELGHGVFMVQNNGLVYNNNYPKYNMITGQIEFLGG